MKKQKMRFISAVLAACMMTSVLPVNALALGGGTPENGVTALENAAIELTPTKSIIIDKGGNYEIPGGNYAGNITINLTDITETVNITIKGNIKPTSADPFIDVKNAGVVNVEQFSSVHDRFRRAYCK